MSFLKPKNFLSILAVVLSLLFTGCDSEKDYITVEGNLPIKTSMLYMVGDATPAGWNIDSPVSLTQDETNPYLFTWEGELGRGEMKMCLATGSWNCTFIRPIDHGQSISSENLTQTPFTMYMGDPDNKWFVTERGTYRITMDLRGWTITTEYLYSYEITPLETESVFLMGDAIPGNESWDWGSVGVMTQDAADKYTFTWQGLLNPGHFKASLERDESYSCPFIRPLAAETEVNHDGVASDNFIFSTSPDDKWLVTEGGEYKLTFNLRDWKVKIEYLGGKGSIQAADIMLMGDAIPGNEDWWWDSVQHMERSTSDSNVFTWEGQLNVGHFKAATVRDESFSCPFIRPSKANVEINHNGVADNSFVYTKDPDDQWNVTEAGIYRLTVDLSKWTITVQYVRDITGGDAIEASQVMLMGDAIPGNEDWWWDSVQHMERSTSDSNVFTWEGQLNTGHFKAATVRDESFSCPFIRPSKANVEINHNGVADNSFVYTKDPDDQWNVTESGKYRITFNLAQKTITVQYIGSADKEDAIEASQVMLMGDAIPGNEDWWWDSVQKMTNDTSNKYLWRWEGQLNTGYFKAATVRDESFSCPFIRPSKADVEINRDGVADNSLVYTKNPDDKWHVTAAGKYELVFDLRKRTITVTPK